MNELATSVAGGAAEPLWDMAMQLRTLAAAGLALPIAAVLGCILAFRPRRRGTPPRTPAVIQTQIILSIVGALVMLIVGQSLARAFGIVGVASLVRYRAKVDDPKDAGVMLAALGVGLASGASLYLLASVATLFILLVLLWIESMEPKPVKLFLLKVASDNPEALRPRVEDLLRRNQARFELRTASNNEICYEVSLPLDRRTDTMSTAILRLDRSKETSVVWDEKKNKAS
jgi:MgtC family/Domain of unknown function (DUF4956)